MLGADNPQLAQKGLIDRLIDLFGSARSAAVTVQGSGGTQAWTAGEKGAVLMSFSSSSTSVSVSRSPMGPSVRT